MTQEPLPPAAPADLSALELIADGVVLIGGDGTVRHATPMAARLLGRSTSQLLGADARTAMPLRTEDGSDWWGCAHPLDVDARLLPRIAEQELSLMLAGGDIRAVAVTGARIAGPDGRVELLVLTLRRADARRRRDVARADLVSTVSHELRSPLTSVKGFTKTLLAKWDRFTDDQKKQMLATVNEDADRVTRLLGELLSVSRIDAGRLQLKRQMIDIGAMATAIAAKVQAGAGQGRTITVDVVGDVPELYADPDRIEQVLSNLLENAIRYTEGAVVVRAEAVADVVAVSVSDEGEGIPEDLHGPIFTKFFRRPGERRQGTGLGLYITKGLVVAHGGEIVVSSVEGTGSTFRFTLPQGGLELGGVDLSAIPTTTDRA